MPYALRRIANPGTGYAGYQRGHEIPESVIGNWNLIEGEDYAAEVPTDDEVPAPIRPADDSDRGAWLAYVAARGTDPAEAALLQIDQLMDLYPEEREIQPADARPAESAKKAEWVDYVIGAGADEAWARSGDTTKADLQEWSPVAHAEPHTTDGAADQGNATVGQ